jgi:hypothetical protein
MAIIIFRIWKLIAPDSCFGYRPLAACAKYSTSQASTAPKATSVGIEITLDVYYGRASVGGKGLTEKAVAVAPGSHSMGEKGQARRKTTGCQLKSTTEHGSGIAPLFVTFSVRSLRAPPAFRIVRVRSSGCRKATRRNTNPQQYYSLSGNRR